DLKKKVVRAIGEPHERFREDRLRMVRAARFAARLGFTIADETAKAIRMHAQTLFPSVSMERIWQELSKMAAHPHFDKALIMLHELGLLQVIFPSLQNTPLSEINKRVEPFIYFPEGTPTMAFLLQLFPNATLKQRLELCDYLKTS